MIRWLLNLFRRRRSGSSEAGAPVETWVERIDVETGTPRPPAPDSAEPPATDEKPLSPAIVRPQPALAPDEAAVVVHPEVAQEPASDTAPPPAPAPRADVVVPTFEIVLPDLSDVDFVNPDHGYAPPPSPPKPLRRERRRTPLAPALVRELVTELRDVRPRLDAAFADEAVTVHLPASDAEPGYVVAALSDAFVVSQGERVGEVRSLRHALTEAHINAERPVDDLDRLELARLVAMAVDGLHRADAVLSRLDLDVFAFSIDERPRVALADGGGVRRLGGEFLSTLSETRGFDDDRADFADLVAVLLSDGGDDIPQTVPGLSETDSRRLHVLRDRAGGEPGTRAPVSEWMEVLGR